MNLRYWLCSVSLLAVLATPAFAQEAPAQSASPPAPKSEASQVGLEDIIVTAQKQSQSLQRTPVAITALTGKELVSAGITDIRGVQSFVPSVRFQPEGASIEIYIRGVGSSLDVPQVEPPTSFNFNGVYTFREAAGVSLYDIDQIEVLPGPQGTLYGRSSLGGAVNVNFKRPTKDLSTDSLLEVGNYSMLHASIAQNVPISEVLAVRGALDYNYRKGYLTSGADSANNIGARLSFLYTPTSDFTAYVWGAIADLNGSSPNVVPKGVNPNTSAIERSRFLNKDPWNDQFPAVLVPMLPFGQPQAEDWKYSNQMVGAQFDLSVSDGVTLTYIPSYAYLSSSLEYWLGAFPGNASIRYSQTTHELRLSGDGDRLKWLVGLYGYRLVSSGTFSFGAFSLEEGGFPVYIIDRNRIQGVAAFGQATYSVTDALRLTAGGRFSHDDRVGRGRFFDGSGFLPYDYAKKFNHVDFKAGVDFDLAQHVMIYATVQTGYQPGTFNPVPSTAVSTNAINPAKMTAYTVGVKSRVLDNNLQINAETFYYDYKDLFVAQYDTVRNTNLTYNAQKIEIYGAQVDLILKASADDNFNVSLGYLHARNKDFTLPNGSNYDGLQLQYAPDWTVNAGYHHDFQLNNGYVRARVNSRYESSFFGDFSHTPGGFQKSYIKTDASLTYFSTSGLWSLGAWIKNIENEAVIAATAGGSNLPFNPQGATSFLEAPRTFGLRGTLSM